MTAMKTDRAIKKLAAAYAENPERFEEYAELQTLSVNDGSMALVIFFKAAAPISPLCEFDVNVGEVWAGK